VESIFQGAWESGVEASAGECRLVQASAVEYIQLLWINVAAGLGGVALFQLSHVHMPDGNIDRRVKSRAVSPSGWWRVRDCSRGRRERVVRTKYA
jgi:hypothetical protein